MSHRHPRRRQWATPALLAAAVLALGYGCTEVGVSSPGAVNSLRVTPDTLLLRVGDSAVVRALPLDASGALLVQRVATWTTSAPAVAVVDAAGIVVGVGSGGADLTASIDGFQGTVRVLVSGAPAAMAASAGNGQSAPVNTAVAVAPAVRVADGTNAPVAGVQVTFAVTGGGGTVGPSATVATGADGIARVGSWTLGPAAGANALTATVAGATLTGSPVTFTATGTVGPPSATQSSIAASPTVIAPSNGVSSSTITVTVRDAAGSTVMGATVSLSATGSGNIITQPTATTDAQGRATGAFSSSVAELKTISATVNGATTLTQTAAVDVTANAPAGLVVLTQPAGAVSNAVFTTQPVVEVRDAFGNRVMGSSAPITVTLASGNGTLVSASGSFTVSAVNGRATFSGLRIRGTRTTGDTLGTGAHVLQFSTPGFTATNSATLNVEVSYAYNIVDVYTRNSCISCHAFTYANSVNQPATLGACAGAARVVPSDTALSVLYEKIRTVSPSCGGPMPGATLMSALQIRLVRDWILQGARNN
ncbi:MAG: Ig-like domain-containing protein [Gemmatimonadales bacterium]|nr:Ig-like domain-containing protein [Gemmatimonadales bacterium]